MPRVVDDQKHKFYNDELFRKLSRESEVGRSRNVSLSQMINVLSWSLATINILHSTLSFCQPMKTRTYLQKTDRVSAAHRIRRVHIGLITQ